MYLPKGMSFLLGFLLYKIFNLYYNKIKVVKGGGVYG